MYVYVCGICGTTKEDPENGYCINGHDHWVEPRDFDNPELTSYVAKSASNLGISLKELMNRCGD